MLRTTIICMLSTGIVAAERGWSDLPLDPWPSPVAPAAMVVAGGAEIRWQPEPVRFVAGPSRRYIDYRDGDDAHDGLTPATAWRHHPWDARAKDVAAATSGVHTYLFKGGVAYRGALVGRESGRADEPIRLTRDPAWGDGPAVIAGSHGIAGGWQRVPADAATALGLSIAASENIWQVALPGDEIPRALWMTTVSGDRERLSLARWPNWQIEHPYNHFTQWHRVERIVKGFPRTTIIAPVLRGHARDAFRGATMWIDHPNTSGEFSVMGPFPSSVGTYDPDQGSLQPQLLNPGRHPRTNSPFFVENLARFLDEPGEWWFDAATRHLYLWPTDDRDPNALQIEAAHHPIIIDLVDAHHIVLSDMVLTGGNAVDPTTAPDTGGHHRPSPVAEMAAIRLQGDCQHIDLAHLHVHHGAGAGIVNHITAAENLVNRITIRDSHFEHLDNDGIVLSRGDTWRRTESRPKARLTQIAIWRNRIHAVGLRSSAGGGQGIDINGPEVLDIAGNVIDRTAAQGINVHGGRPTGGWMGRDAPATPLIRIQIRHNQVREPLLRKTDFGGIEFWGQGPAYVYNNIVVNPVGLVAHNGTYSKNECYYFDHGFKGYLFNNLGWSDESPEAHLGVLGDNFFKEVRNRWNQAFHNTAYRLRAFHTHSGAHGDQQHYLANLAIDMRGRNFGFWRLTEAAGIAHANNLTHGNPEWYYARFRGDSWRSLEEFSAQLAPLGNQINGTVGWASDVMPVVDPSRADFRPTDDSPLIDRGVRVFVPWGMHGVVGEWQFRLEPGAPHRVLGEDLYPQDFYADNSVMMFDNAVVPGNDLLGTDFSVDDYRAGVLEDWNRGALHFDGQKTMRVDHARLVRGIQIGKDGDKRTILGHERQTLHMERNDFLIEAVFQARSGGVIAGKMGPAAGYELGLDALGHVQLRLRTDSGVYVLRSRVAVTDGRWHHVIAEVDRAAGHARLFLNGRETSETTTTTMPAVTASLANEADFVVGAGFVGALDFLRVARGTLAAAATDIDEVMRWQFNGPHLHDFTGQPPTGSARDIGAIEHPTVAGRQPISYTPPAPITPEIAVVAPEPPAEDFLRGPDRVVQPFDWGAISVPATAAVGKQIQVQVAFETEAVAREQRLQIDFHGFIDGKRVPGLGRSAPQQVVPGVTTPFNVGWTIPDRTGLERVAVVIYLSPDGSWPKRTLTGSAEIRIVPAP